MIKRRLNFAQDLVDRREELETAIFFGIYFKIIYLSIFIMPIGFLMLMILELSKIKDQDVMSLIKLILLMISLIFIFILFFRFMINTNLNREIDKINNLLDENNKVEKVGKKVKYLRILEGRCHFQVNSQDDCMISLFKGDIKNKVREIF
ncbi:MAG: hypothetical protein Q4D53_06900 [Leptotrichiaceae bacterium]|nr:hypothetical protein [Leptotrichiaceae bacterium]